MKLLVITMDQFQDIELVSFIGTLNTSQKIEKITYWNPDGKNKVYGIQKIGIIETISNDINVNEYDAIFIPGGPACKMLRTNNRALSLIKKFIELDKWIFAICDGPNALIDAKLQLDKKYVSYPIENIENVATNLRQPNDKTFVDGKYITGNCPNSSIIFGLKVIETLYGEELKEKVLNRLSGGLK